MTAIWEPSAADVEMVQLLDEKGIASAVAEYADFFPDDDSLRELYRLMVLARRIDEEAVRLQRQGELALYPPILGQEAAQVASACAFDREDWMFIGYRDLGPLIVRRVEPSEVMQFWRGTWHGGGWDPRSSHVAPYCAPVATQLPHSVGFALGEKLAGRQGVVGCYFGDGATSAGDFHEACNFAGVFQAPVVFICQNNHVALSVPLHRQTAAPAIAAKALGYGFRGVRVDGNDALAMYSVVREAVCRARNGGGPTLIEAVTYRMGPHSTADDPTRYRQQADVDAWASRDPLDRFRSYLCSRDLLDEQGFAEADDVADDMAMELRARIVRSDAPDPASMFDFVVADASPGLREQRVRLVGEMERRRGAEGGARV